MLSFFSSRFQKVKAALAKTHAAFTFRLRALSGKPWDDETLELLEQILFESDLGSEIAQDFINHLRSELRLKGAHNLSDIVPILKERAKKILTLPSALKAQRSPHVILVVGVNGSGKTTSIAKLAKHYADEGKKVILAAADTFRAAAIDQLCHWAEKIGVDIISSMPGADPSAVAYDAMVAAKARGADIVIIDTAGRLQNKTDLMLELEKIRRICSKHSPGAPDQTLLVLDATTGQNAVDQALTFHKFTPLHGIILTKLDGSAKGGVILSIYKRLSLPVLWIGVGEGEKDLMPFDKEEFVDALFDA